MGHNGEGRHAKQERRNIFVSGFIAGWWACSVLLLLMVSLDWVAIK